MLSSQNRNLSDRLIRVIESNAETLTKSTVQKLQSNGRTDSYHHLSYGDVYSRVYTVYHDLGRWLWEKSTEAVQAWYNGLGAKRYDEGIALAEVLWALVLTKDRLLEYLAAHGLGDSAMELYQQQEFERLIGRFFDRAMCYTAEGYAMRASIHRESGSSMLIH